MKGFSLVEILVVVAILGIIVAGIFVVSNVANISWDSSTGMLDLQQQARQAMERMVREIRQIDGGSPINITAGADDISFFITDDITNPDSPVTYSVRYFLNASQVLRENPANDPDTQRVLANDVASLVFSQTNSILEIQLGLAKTIKQLPLSFSLTERVRLRNE